MNLKILAKAFVALLATSLIAYSFSIIGVPGTPVDSFWKLFALVLGVSIVTGYAWPQLRGVRKGDMLMVVERRHQHEGDFIQNIIDSYLVTALEDGRIGNKIKVRISNQRNNNLKGEGVIISYAETLRPARIRLTESEVQVKWS
ncbi:hypothetical protein KJ765_05755 [Candidatus Micrarchaeota archaeon]|nr:hypothetical protein [Candidatus Micrarchaeota archaeon]